MKQLSILLLIITLSYCKGQDKKEMSFEEYEPKSTLVVEGKPITKAKYPFIDVHNHQDNMDEKAHLDGLIGDMDKMNMVYMVNLSGKGWGKSITDANKLLDGSTKNIAINWNYS